MIQKEVETQILFHCLQTLEGISVGIRKKNMGLILIEKREQRN